MFKCAEFEQSGFQKYEQPTKNFCLTENLEEFFSEIKSSSNLKNFCHFERRDVITQIGFKAIAFEDYLKNRLGQKIFKATLLNLHFLSFIRPA